MIEFKKDENGVDEFELPFLAEQVMKMDDLGKRDGRWNLVIYLKLNGILDKEKLEKSINKMFENNDAMRVISVRKEGKFKFRILKEYKFNLEVKKIKGKTREESILLATKDANKIGAQAIDVFNTVGYRFLLYEISEMEHFLLIVGHHTVCDPTSLYLFSVKLMDYYNKGNSPFDKVSTSYMEYLKDYAAFENSKEAEEQRRYWEKELAGYKYPYYGIDETKESLISAEYGNFEFDSNVISQIAKDNNMSKFHVVMLIFHIAMAKIYKTNDTIVNYAISDRNEEKYVYTIGAMARYMINRLKFNDNDKVKDMFPAIRKKLAEGFKYSKESQLYKKAPYVITYQEGTMKMPEFNGNPIDYVPLESKRTFTDMLIIVMDMGNTILVTIDCDTRCFDREYLDDIKRICTEVQYILANNKDMTFKEIMEEDPEENILLI